MVIRGVSINCFAALSATSCPIFSMCADSLLSMICFLWFWSSVSMSYTWFNSIHFNKGYMGCPLVIYNLV